MTILSSLIIYVKVVDRVLRNICCICPYFDSLNRIKTNDEEKPKIITITNGIERSKSKIQPCVITKEKVNSRTTMAV